MNIKQLKRVLKKNSNNTIKFINKGLTKINKFVPVPAIEGDMKVDTKGHKVSKTWSKTELNLIEKLS